MIRSSKASGVGRVETVRWFLKRKEKKGQPVVIFRSKVLVSWASDRKFGLAFPINLANKTIPRNNVPCRRLVPGQLPAPTIENFTSLILNKYTFRLDDSYALFVCRASMRWMTHSLVLSPSFPFHRIEREMQPRVGGALLLDICGCDASSRANETTNARKTRKEEEGAKLLIENSLNASSMERKSWPLGSLFGAMVERNIWDGMRRERVEAQLHPPDLSGRRYSKEAKIGRRRRRASINSARRPRHGSSSCSYIHGTPVFKLFGPFIRFVINMVVHVGGRGAVVSLPP